MSDTKAEKAALLITGVLIGATVGLLFAPQSGARTRKKIRKQARRSIERLEDLEHDIRLQVNEWVEDVADAVDEGLHRGRKLTVTGKEKVLGVFDGAKHYVDQGRSRIERLIGGEG